MACGILLADLEHAQTNVTLGHDAVLEGPPALDRLPYHHPRPSYLLFFPLSPLDLFDFSFIHKMATPTRNTPEGLQESSRSTTPTGSTEAVESTLADLVLEIKEFVSDSSTADDLANDAQQRYHSTEQIALQMRKTYPEPSAFFEQATNTLQLDLQNVTEKLRKKNAESRSSKLPPPLRRMLTDRRRVKQTKEMLDPAFYHYKEAMEKHKKQRQQQRGVRLAQASAAASNTREGGVESAEDAGEVKLKGSAVPSVAGSAAPSTSVYLL
ncbi:hypothetical protein B9479_000390 [Cryptococcus floricola]|uniref:Uncharacterized protein n=1 Tax=Cryptococcus floricola TaxID=2591691 RepID=A0A5D3B7Z9_9TREE|nr:hypothetical protein B9479_000390 [Cryptococcus floricola]